MPGEDETKKRMSEKSFKSLLFVVVAVVMIIYVASGIVEMNEEAKRAYGDEYTNSLMPDLGSFPEGFSRNSNSSQGAMYKDGVEHYSRGYYIYMPSDQYGYGAKLCSVYVKMYVFSSASLAEEAFIESKAAWNSGSTFSFNYFEQDLGWESWSSVYGYIILEGNIFVEITISGILYNIEKPAFEPIVSNIKSKIDHAKWKN